MLLFFDDAVKVRSGLFSSVDLCAEVRVCVLQVPCVAFLRLSPRREGLMFALRLVLLEGQLQPVGSSLVQSKHLERGDCTGRYLEALLVLLPPTSPLCLRTSFLLSGGPHSSGGQTFAAFGSWLLSGDGPSPGTGSPAGQLYWPVRSDRAAVFWLV